MHIESVSIALSCADLDEFPICTCDVQNSYLQAPSSEKYYVVCSQEFGLENVGKHAIVVRAIYVGEYPRDEHFRHALCSMEEIVFSSYKAHPHA